MSELLDLASILRYGPTNMWKLKENASSVFGIMIFHVKVYTNFPSRKNVQKICQDTGQTYKIGLAVDMMVQKRVHIFESIA